MHTVSVYERIPGFGKSLDSPSVDQYTQSVVQLVNDQIKWIDDIVANLDVSQGLKEDLRRIIEFRNQRYNP